MGSPLGVREMLGNYIEVVVAQHGDVLNATELFTLKWLILCYVNFTSIKESHHLSYVHFIVCKLKINFKNI